MPLFRLFCALLVMFAVFQTGALPAEGSVPVSDLRLNEVDFRSSPSQITIYRELAPFDTAIISGRLATPAAGIVEVSLDGKETWEPATLAANGEFTYLFQPEQGRIYRIYVKVRLADGQTNDPEETAKTVVFSSKTAIQAVRDSLDKLVAAYSAKNSGAFLQNAGSAFAGNMQLGRALQRDFLALDNISLRYSIAAFAVDRSGLISVSVHFNRSALTVKRGIMVSDHGITEFVFKVGTQGPELYRMKAPLLFGLSDASRLATSFVTSGENSFVLAIDSRGDAGLTPVSKSLLPDPPLH